jgi:hypothetical protein
MKRILIFTILIALAVVVCIPIFHTWSNAATRAKFLRIRDGNPAMTIDQVEVLLGRPASIEQSETADQTISGEAYQYPIADGEMKIVFVNGVVFHAEFVPRSQIMTTSDRFLFARNGPREPGQQSSPGHPETGAKP